MNLTAHHRRPMLATLFIVCGAVTFVTSCRSNRTESSTHGSDASGVNSGATPIPEKPSPNTRTHGGRSPQGRAIAISAGGTHACIRTDSDDLYCWGMNAGGEVGDGTINHGSPFENVRNTPFHVGKIEKIKTIELGSMLSLALGPDGAIWVWGSTIHLEPLLDGKFKEHLRPEKLNVALRLQSMSTSGRHACGLDADGQVHCWGENDYGELGDGTTLARQFPKRVELPEIATFVSVSSHHSCAVVRSGDVYCWGLDPRGRPLDSPDEPLGGFHGVLPIDPMVPGANAHALPGPPPHSTFDPHHPQPKMHADTKPVRIAGLENTSSITLGEATSTMQYACALGRDSNVRCWGANDRGQLADGTFIDRSTPLPVKDINDAVSVFAAGSRTCVIRKDRSLWCWGLRYGIAPVSAIPIREPLSDVHDFALGTDFACAIHGDSIVSCWGDNYYAQLGNGTRDSSVAPVPVVF